MVVRTAILMSCHLRKAIQQIRSIKKQRITNFTTLLPRKKTPNNNILELVIKAERDNAIISRKKIKPTTIIYLVCLCAVLCLMA